ncbi:MAG: hypothetical protein IIT46_16295 [Lachnospiraceae bacterium]|nr:hypothetical protein [Lachnospiraceae bacterium]
MKDHDLLEAVGGINEKYVNNAESNQKKKKHGYIKWVSVAAACLCLIVIAGIMIAKMTNQDRKITDNPQNENNLTIAENSDDKKDANQNTQSNEVVEGVSIPAIELPDSSDIGAADVIGLIVYQGHIFTQAEIYLGEDAHRIESLVGEYIGTAKGNIEAWSSQDDYAEELASTISGEVYSVNGYDDSFRICIKAEREDENQNRVLWIGFYDCLNGITLTTGRDLFDERLHIIERTAAVQWQSHNDWNYGLGNIQNTDINEDVWNEFWNAVNDCGVINTWSPDNNMSDPTSNHETIYDNQNQAHLILTMNDETVVRIRLFEGGYVGYGPLGGYLVRIPEDVFNPLYDACGGTH